jgi:hypothetical protein
VAEASARRARAQGPRSFAFGFEILIWSGFERARPYRLRKNSTSFGFVTGHDFSRADKANKMNRALAPAKAYSLQKLEAGPFFRSLFGRATMEPRMVWALAPEGRLMKLKAFS